ncbi:MAG: GNAT family N-acetyltransferase [Bacteroidales bacterium]|nr:GNAT family N-acetyltransferase [Bacteroidales bacterium]
MKFLENENIRLRSLEPEDLEFLYKWENDTSLWEYGNTLTPFSKYILRQYLEKASLDIFDVKQLRLIIEDKVTKTPAGTIDLYDFDPYHNRAGIGILVDEIFQRKSFATQSLKLMEEYAFKFLKINQLYAFIPTFNVPSLHLFRKCGFVEVGLLKKWYKNLDGNGDVFFYQLLNSAL